MSFPTYPTPSDVDKECTFSSANILGYTSTLPNYFLAIPGNISLEFSKNYKNDEILPVFSPFYNNPYLKDMQAYNAATNKSHIPPPDPITPPAILTPSPMPPKVIQHAEAFSHAYAASENYNSDGEEKVKFAINTLTEEALFWWNSFTQPTRVEEAYKNTWSEFKRLLIKKYCPQTEIKKMEVAITMTQKLIEQAFNGKDQRRGGQTKIEWLELEVGERPRGLEASPLGYK
ncbi:hypothetical protein Tco_0766894 [Tanacetum coccineum]